MFVGTDLEIPYRGTLVSFTSYQCEVIWTPRQVADALIHRFVGPVLSELVAEPMNQVERACIPYVNVFVGTAACQKFATVGKPYLPDLSRLLKLMQQFVREKFWVAVVIGIQRGSCGSRMPLASF